MSTRSIGIGVAVITLSALGCSNSGPASAPSGRLGDGELPGAGANIDAEGPATGAGTPTLDPGTSGGTDSSGSGGASSSSGGISSSGSTGSSAGASSAGAPGTAGSGGQVAPGTLTAGAWDDNRNFERFLGFRSSEFDAQLPGLMPISEDEHRAARASQADLPHQRLDVSLVIDTTGSMGDEMAYLTSEFVALSSTIEARHPGAEQRWSLVVYRDVTDDYIVRWFDFRSDLVEFQSKLAAQSAGGGGDFPEAPDQALATAAALGWRTDPDVARLVFWVADAPHHDDKAQAMADAVRSLALQDIHVYPVASSGIDDLTELTMRSAAQFTGGRYLFLTDDSGVGNAHKEPRIPCYFVTKLDAAILRMVDIEMSGTYREPDASEVIRTGGDPQDGACQLDSGETVLVF